MSSPPASTIFWNLDMGEEDQTHLLLANKINYRYWGYAIFLEKIDLPALRARN